MGDFTCKGKNGGAKVGSVAAMGTTNLLVFKALSKAAGKIVKAETPLIQKSEETSSVAGNNTSDLGANGTLAAANVSSMATNNPDKEGVKALNSSSNSTPPPPPP